MHAGGGKAYQRVPRLNSAAIHNFRPVHQAHGKTSQVILPFGIETGHLGGFPADKGAPRLAAAVGHALHDLRRLLGHQLSCSQVVQEDQRRCALANNVVHAHRHAIDTHRIVNIHHKGQFQLGAHAVGAGHHHRVLPAQAGYRKEAAKGAQVAQHPVAEG